MFLVAFTGSVKYNRCMNDITKNKIARTSELLFNAHGYNNVTMRQIADACGISVGNLTYHYPKKEDLLMLEHDGIMNSFLDRVFADVSELTGLRGYFTVEAAFLHRILNDPPVARLYAEVINVPTLRSRYCRTHFELYRRFLPEVPDGGAEWLVVGIGVNVAQRGCSTILSAQCARFSAQGCCSRGRSRAYISAIYTPA